MEEVHRADPTRVMMLEVRRHIRGTLLRPNMLQRLHLFADADVPKALMQNVHDQIEQVQPVPKSLAEHSRAELDAFPKLFDFPEDYVLERSQREFLARENASPDQSKSASELKAKK